MVSIRCCAFNQAELIGKCLDGFVKQKTNFRFEAVVHDDASTDGTAAVIARYAERYPDIIKPIYEAENQYSKHDGSLSRIMDAATHGKYVAYCEGDDCWTDPLKLQKQVDWLESHPDCVLVHTDMDVVDTTTDKCYSAKWRRQKNFNLIQRDWGNRLLPLLMQGRYSATTLTVCARVDKIRECQEEGLLQSDKKLLMGDTTLWMALSTKGSFHLIPDVCACYHAVSESATHSRNYSNVITFYLSCFDMIDLFAHRFAVSSRDKDIAMQKYLFYLLRDVYTDKSEFLGELDERVLQGRRLNFANRLLRHTMHSPKFAKKLLLAVIQCSQAVQHEKEFFMAKYFGRV